jgi:hypothetical protein
MAPVRALSRRVSLKCCVSGVLMLAYEQVPDILFAGIPVATSSDSVFTAFKKGWLIYIKDIGCVCSHLLLAAVMHYLFRM